MLVYDCRDFLLTLPNVLSLASTWVFHTLSPEVETK